MLTLFLFVGVYSALSFYLLARTQAFTMSLMASVAILGVLLLTRSRSLRQALQWFLAFRWRGLWVLTLTVASFVLTEIYASPSLGQIVLQTTMVFLWFWMFVAIDTYRGHHDKVGEPVDARILRVERETLEYRRGSHSILIGAYGSWKRGAVVELVVNGRWNPPGSGPVLAEEDLADIEQRLRAYAAESGVIPRITVDRT